LIQTLSIANGEMIDYRIPIGAKVSAAAFTSQGQVVALVGRTILTWKPEKNAKVQQIDTTINLTAMALTPDGQRVLVGGRNGELALFRLIDGQLIRSMTVPGPVQSLSIAPDGQSYSVITETRDGRQLIGQSAAMLSESITQPPTNPR
jgi:WD40 repeat protein